MKTKKEILKKVLKNADSNKQSDIESAWFTYLDEKLKFPYKAKINLISFSRAVKDGDIVKVTGVDNWIDLYGVLMNVKKDGQRLEIPIEELEVIDKNSKNYRIIDAFLDWYGEAFG